jgi:hypothetical protein
MSSKPSRVVPDGDELTAAGNCVAAISSMSCSAMPRPTATCIASVLEWTAAPSAVNSAAPATVVTVTPISASTSEKPGRLAREEERGGIKRTCSTPA